MLQLVGSLGEHLHHALDDTIEAVEVVNLEPLLGLAPVWAVDLHVEVRFVGLEGYEDVGCLGEIPSGVSSDVD